MVEILRRAAVVGLAAMLLVGCSGSASPEPSPVGGAVDVSAERDAAPRETDTSPADANATVQALDVCGMLDEATVQQVLGETATPTDQSTGDLYACSWQGIGDALNVMSVSVYVHPDSATAQQMYQATLEGLDASEIMGLGQAASYNESFGLDVLHDRFEINVDNTGSDEKASDLLVAQQVIAQLSS